MPTISFEEFQKVELRVVKVLEAERVVGSEKLLKLKVDMGTQAATAENANPEKEIRQIIAGIGKKYEPETLLGKEIVIVANLEPRMLMGLESQGMVLAAHDDSGPILIQPETEVAPGEKLG